MLYEKRIAPDNWVPPDFLTRLQKNVNLRTFDISTLIIYSGLIFQHLCSICLFVTSYIFLLWKWITPFQIQIALLTATCFGAALWFFAVLKPDEQSFTATLNPLRSGFIILVFSSSLAPVLHSLLGTVSTDTIHAMTFVFLLLNFISLPYANGMRVCRVDGTSDSNTVSVATGFLASLCMSSRLAGPKETLLLIIFATLNFATWSTIRHQIQARRGPVVRLSFTIGMGLIATLGLLPFFYYGEIDYIYKRLLAGSILLSTILINFGFPFLFYKMQSTKANINGPWDEAIIQH
ncbi:unnamed protein product [Rodentolepis nana]|uniref:Phosphatidylinositol N-acetylglucosaminyltransferase subunit C n=1 Tax=Rodentolepis nana TaxID=102285 RepID=A0A0R3TPZ6_RODNA|nr:unnamed protein product [Rodentolepis nana]